MSWFKRLKDRVTLLVAYHRPRDFDEWLLLSVTSIGLLCMAGAASAIWYGDIGSTTMYKAGKIQHVRVDDESVYVSLVGDTEAYYAGEVDRYPRLPATGDRATVTETTYYRDVFKPYGSSIVVHVTFGSTPFDHKAYTQAVNLQARTVPVKEGP